MVRKCGFFDCSNSEEKNKGCCQNCEGRKEQNVCSACRQPEEQDYILGISSSLIKKKYTYEMGALIKKELPVQLQTKLDQLLSRLKLTTNEQELIQKMENLLADFLAEKGGKQDHVDWFKLCSVCSPEFESKGQDFKKNYPQSEVLWKGIEEKEKKFEKFIEDSESTIGKEELRRIGKEVEEEWYKQIENNPSPNKPNQKDNNFAEVARLQKEINNLKREISQLKKAGNSDNSNVLRDKESKLKNKEIQLKKELSKNNSPTSSNSSNLPLYLGAGGAVMVIFLIVIIFLIFSKKKKKQ